MATNRYFNRIKQESEQDLFEDMVVEMIQMNGIDVLYIPREIFQVDPVLKEPVATVFQRSFPIEVYMPDAAQFGGDQNIMSKFGFRINQTTELVMSKRRFAELGTGRIRPREGDLIYIGDPDQPHSSFINQMFEINQVWFNNPDWQFGRHFTYRIVCESWTGSYEKFQTGKTGLDQFNLPNQEEINAASNNQIIDQKQDLLVFDTNNPFGEY